MKLIKYTFILTLLFNHLYLSSQSIGDLKWKNRVIMLHSDNINNSQLTEQLKILDIQSPDWKDRKLKIFIVLPEGVRTNNEGQWIVLENFDSEKAGEKINKPFDFRLIGLDGTVKFKSSSPLSQKEINAIVDSMPMRRAEERSKNP